MIRTFRTQGFKSLLDASLELGILNVFIGANGSGKSNILEAIGVLGAGASGTVEPESLRYRGVRLGLPKLYKSSFVGRNLRRIITLEASGNKGFPLYRLGLSNPIDSPRVQWQVSSESLEESEGFRLISRSPRNCKVHHGPGEGSLTFGVSAEETAARSALPLVKGFALGQARAATELLSLLEGYAIYSPSTPVLRGLESDIARHPLGLSGSRLPDCLKELLDESKETLGDLDLAEIWDLIDWAEKLSVVPPERASLAPGVVTRQQVIRFTDRFMRQGRNTLSAYDASEGALFVLFLLGLVCHPESPRLAAVDNFDQALHPRLAAVLTRTLAEILLERRDRQVLFTTHNPMVLDGLDLSNDEVRLFAVEREDDGPTRIRRIQLSAELLDSARDGQLPLSRLWVMGRLGGIPKNL